MHRKNVDKKYQVNIVTNMHDKQFPILHRSLSRTLHRVVLHQDVPQGDLAAGHLLALRYSERRQQFVARMNVQVDHINVSSLQEGADLVQLGVGEQMLEQLCMCLVAPLA